MKKMHKIPLYPMTLIFNENENFMQEKIKYTQKLTHENLI